MNESKTAQLITILFTAGDEVSLRVIQKQLEIEQEEVMDLVMAARGVLRPLGLVIVSDGTALQIAVAPEYGDWVSGFQKNAQAAQLTPAALETLATVAYLGGATKTEVDFVRGVNSYFTLRTLSLRGMLKKDQAEHYTLTNEALGNLGVQDLHELPDWNEVHEELRSQLTVNGDPVVE